MPTALLMIDVQPSFSRRPCGFESALPGIRVAQARQRARVTA
jgi:hypothetical protein